MEGEGGAKVGEGVGVVCESAGFLMCLGEVTMLVVFLATTRSNSVECFVEKVYIPPPEGHWVPVSIVNLSDSEEYFLRKRRGQM